MRGEGAMRFFNIVCCSLLFCFSWGVAQHSEVFREKMFRLQELQRRTDAATSVAAITAGQEGFDVTYYNLDLHLSTPSQTLTGTVTIVARSLAAPLSSITLDLAQTMTVYSVKVGSVNVNFTRGAGTLIFPLDRSY